MARVLMLTTDRKLDRRIVLEARTLCRIGFEVRVIAAPWADEDCFIGKEPFEIIRVGGDNHTDAVFLSRHRVYSYLLNIYTHVRTRFPRLGAYLNLWKSFARAYMLDVEQFYNSLFLSQAQSWPADVVHVHDLHPLPAGCIVASRHGAALIYDSHELFCEQDFIPKDRAKWQHIERRYIGSADYVITINKAIAQELEQRYNIVRPTVIQNCESRAHRMEQKKGFGLHWLSQFGVTPDTNIVLYQGGLIPNRNLELIIAAMAHVQTAQVALVILGDGELHYKLATLIREKHLNGKIHLVPAVPQKMLLGVTARAQLGVIPYQATCLNTYYCTPNKLYEFIAAGIPLLVNDLPELRRIVTQYDIGWVTKMKTPRQVAQAIDTALRSSDKLEHIRQNCIKTFKTLCWEVEEKKLIAIYAGLNL